MVRDGSRRGAAVIHRARIADWVVLAWAAVWLLVNLVTATTAVTAGATRVKDARLAAEVSASVSSSGLPDTDVFAAALGAPSFEQWWGVRPTPSRDGGDFLRVLDHLPPERTLGSVVGAVLQRASRAGTRVNELIIPKDTASLFGMVPFDVTVQPDGSTVQTPWTGIDSYVLAYTDVNVAQRDYRPELTDQQIAAIKRDYGLVALTHSVSEGESPEHASGDWVIYSTSTLPRAYFLLPVEDSPMKGVR